MKPETVLRIVGHQQAFISVQLGKPFPIGIGLSVPVILCSSMSRISLIENNPMTMMMNSIPSCSSG